MQVSIDQVGIQAGGHFQSLITGVDGGKHFLRREQFQACQQCRAGEHHLLHPVDGGDQKFAGLDQGIVLPSGDKVRTQERTNQPSARGEFVALHALVQNLGPCEVAVRAAFQ